MTSKQINAEGQKTNRDRLFKGSKPTIRAAIAEDAVWIRVNQKLQDIVMEDDDFNALMDRTFSQYSEVVIIEDRNARFGSEFGPIGIVAAIQNGNVYEPHVEWFQWATKRNMLRGSVAYFQKFRYRKIGTMVVHCLKDSVSWFRALKKYVPLRYVGKIPDGDPHGRGTDYIFYQRCMT